MQIELSENEKVGYKKLRVWQKADELAFTIYQETKSFPKEEIYGLTSQIRRSSLSVPTNTAEGCGRQGKNELRHFLHIALGSLAETEYLIYFCHRLGYLKPNVSDQLEKMRKEIGSLLWNFYKSI